MSGSIAIATATAEDAHRLAPSMRAGDALEAMSWTGTPPLETLQYCLEASSRAWTATAAGEVVAMFGVVPVPDVSDVGLMWMLSGAAVEKHRKDFVRAAREGLALMLEAFPILTNAVDARYAGAIRLVEWLGFHVIREVKAPQGERFLQVAISRDTWHP